MLRDGGEEVVRIDGVGLDRDRPLQLLDRSAAYARPKLISPSKSGPLNERGLIMRQRFGELASRGTNR